MNVQKAMEVRAIAGNRIKLKQNARFKMRHNNMIKRKRNGEDLW